MNLSLAKFQIQAINDLMEAMKGDQKEVILKSATGSGKTIILTHFMDVYSKIYPRTVFVWLTPGKGELEEQSKLKMEKYIAGANTKSLSQVMTDGFSAMDFCFINWEKLTKKGNTALRDSENVNFAEHITNAKRNNLEFIVVIDESHQNDTIKADEIITLFNAKKIIRNSATPNRSSNALLIEIPEYKVIQEGLIKKQLIINENFVQSIVIDNQLEFLVERSLEKLHQLEIEYTRIKSSVNPLLVIQLPNNSELLQNQVETLLINSGINYENQKLAIWLSDQKMNLEGIEKNDSPQKVIIIKQAVATGWDCPRAQILLKLRENSSETFEIQTIGRIRRMPEVKHYENEVLDSCYLFTFDEKFTEGVRQSLGKNALDAAIIRLKSEFSDFSLIGEQKTAITISRDSKQALKALRLFYQQKYHLSTKLTDNLELLKHQGYIFSNEIIKHTFTGKAATLDKSEFDSLQKIEIKETLNTHTHGREYHQRVSELGLKLGFQYTYLNAILKKLFYKPERSANTILSLEARELYAFILNNYQKIKDDFRDAMSIELNQGIIDFNSISTFRFTFPKEFLFTYNSASKSNAVYDKNVYSNYLSSAEFRSSPEKKFEKYCQHSNKIKWFYKNGDKGNEFFSIVYEDNFGKQKSFYPDYIIGVAGDQSQEIEVWIVETKGGFDRYGNSEDIDSFSPKKFEILKNYLQKYNLKGGFVREDKSSYELCICIDEYSDNISDENWLLLSDVL
jgi:type III restriction enzyme